MAFQALSKRRDELSEGYCADNGRALVRTSRSRQAGDFFALKEAQKKAQKAQKERKKGVRSGFYREAHCQVGRGCGPSLHDRQQPGVRKSKRGQVRFLPGSTLPSWPR